MKEIKLKGWNVLVGRMSGIMTLKEIHGLKEIQWQNIKWLKYTGLKDISGIEIYEGDIIAYCHIERQGDKTARIVKEKGHEVVHKLGCFFLNNEPLGYEWEEDKFVECDTQQWATVIGNVYANPYLLQ